MTRFWFWFVPALVLAAVSIYTVLGAFVFFGGIPSVQFLMCGLFFYPILLIVLAIGQVMLRRRRPMEVTPVERGLMVASATLALLLVATAFDIEALLVGGVLWPFALAATVALAVAIALTNRRRASSSPGAAPGSPSAGDEPTGSLDDLFDSRGPREP